MAAGASEALGVGGEVVICPLADGGDSSMEVLVENAKGEIVTVDGVRNPLGEPVQSQYGLIHDGKTAVIEIARCSGLAMVSDRRNPDNATTAGVADLIKHATDRGVDTIILCIGGSATNDMGIGMAHGLGYTFYDAAGAVINDPRGRDLCRVQSVCGTWLGPRVVVGCDVVNPLCGEQGATMTYGRQKGANDEMLDRLEQGMLNMARVVGEGMVDFPGAGAAGGLGAGCKVFLNAEIRTGFDIVAEAAQLGPALDSAALLITGEGQIDSQTTSGKVIGRLSALAATLNPPPHIAVIAGTIHTPPPALPHTSVFSLCNRPLTLDEAMDPVTAKACITEAAKNITTLFMAERGR